MCCTVSAVDSVCVIYFLIELNLSGTISVPWFIYVFYSSPSFLSSIFLSFIPPSSFLSIFLSLAFPFIFCFFLSKFFLRSFLQVQISNFIFILKQPLSWSKSGYAEFFFFLSSFSFLFFSFPSFLPSVLSSFFLSLSLFFFIFKYKRLNKRLQQLSFIYTRSSPKTSNHQLTKCYYVIPQDGLPSPVDLLP